MRGRRLTVPVLLAAFIGFGGAVAAGQTPRVGDATPEITGQPWINSGPLTMAALRGRVVLVEFWTYG